MQTVRTKIFEYGQKEMDYLKNADPILGKVIDRIGKIERVIIPDLFPALIYAIIGQQISLKACKTIWARMQDQLSPIVPEHIASISVEDIQQLGMQTKKAGYIKGIAQKAASGEFDLNRLYELSDEEAVKQLSSLSGIGKWTAEMLLLNCLERQDIVSYGDIAIRRGMMKLYDLPELSKEQFEVYRRRYSPYGSVASIYLWRVSYE
ncbi:MAG: DNA-3-methyladenine glycosylase 2 family protein [Lachnospiraceae bacterium]|nr:DNA-3-methyladenine glycosylase 2 family protein [Lachnospiraceae bacterium]